MLGGAACVWADVVAACQVGEFAGIVGCNDVGTMWPEPFDAWVSLHADNFLPWIARRRGRGLPDHKALITHSTAATSCPRIPPEVTGFVDHRFPGQETVGSSGLFALKVALIDLGFDKAVLCGVPMSAQANHLRHPDRPWTDADPHWPGWVEALPEIAGRARSMSGRTRQLLGAPSSDWIK